MTTKTRRSNRKSPEEQAAIKARRTALIAQVDGFEPDDESVEAVLELLTQRYSVRNSILILLQRPTTKGYVQSFTKWKADNRAVKSGEKALWILAPIKASEKRADAVELEHKDPDTKETKKLRFIWVPVFDYSQTEPGEERAKRDAERFRLQRPDLEEVE